MISTYYFILFACGTRSKPVSKPMNSLSTLYQMLWTWIDWYFPTSQVYLWNLSFYFLIFLKKIGSKCQAVFFAFLWDNSTLVPKWCIHCVAAAYYSFLRMFDENYRPLLRIVSYMQWKTKNTCLKIFVDKKICQNCVILFKNYKL